MKMIVDDRDGIYNTDIEINNGDKIISDHWLLKLDGKRHTLMVLEREDGWQLMIGGGKKYYVINLQKDDEYFHFVNENGDQAINIELCAGGQFSEFPEAMCANHAQLPNIVELFFSGQERKLRWELQ